MGIRAASRRLSSIEPVWWLNAVIGAVAGVLYVVCVRHLEPIQRPEIAWWWTLGVMVLVTERWPVELEFRRSTHSFSLTDIPLTLALVFATGTHAFVARRGRHRWSRCCCAGCRRSSSPSTSRSSRS